MSFNSGDLVIGKPNNGYSITNDKKICRVIHLCSDNIFMEVEVLRNVNGIKTGIAFAGKYTVYVDRFVPYRAFNVKRDIEI
jgi:hypothetical protein